jgi:hypothetical protein
MKLVDPVPVAPVTTLSATGSSPVHKFCAALIDPGITVFTVMQTIFDVAWQLVPLELKVTIRLKQVLADIPAGGS